MNVIIYLPTSADELQSLKNGKSSHTRKRQLKIEKQTERIRAGYGIRFFVRGDKEGAGDSCVRMVKDITRTNTTIEFKLEPLA